MDKGKAVIFLGFLVVIAGILIVGTGVRQSVSYIIGGMVVGILGLALVVLGTQLAE